MYTNSTSLYVWWYSVSIPKEYLLLKVWVESEASIVVDLQAAKGIPHSQIV